MIKQNTTENRKENIFFKTKDSGCNTLKDGGWRNGMAGKEGSGMVADCQGKHAEVWGKDTEGRWKEVEDRRKEAE